MPKLVEVNPEPEVGYDATQKPVMPPLDHAHTMRQIGVEHHWLEEYGAYEAIPVMECSDPLCSHQDGRKAEFNQETKQYDLGDRLEWNDAVHTEYVVIDRDETGAHLR